MPLGLGKKGGPLLKISRVKKTRKDGIRSETIHGGARNQNAGKKKKGEKRISQ